MITAATQLDRVIDAVLEICETTREELRASQWHADAKLRKMRAVGLCLRVSGASQVDVSEALGVRQGTVSRLVAALRIDPERDTLEGRARALLGGDYVHEGPEVLDCRRGDWLTDGEQTLRVVYVSGIEIELADPILPVCCDGLLIPRRTRLWRRAEPPGRECTAA